MKLRRLFSLAGFALFGWLVWRERASLYQFALLARTINPLYFLLIAALQIVYYLPYAQMYKYSFRLFGVEASLKDLYPLGFVAMFVNSVVPAGGLAGIAPVNELAQRLKQSPAKAASGYIFTGLAELFTIIVFVCLTPFLLRQGELPTEQYHQALTSLTWIVATVIVLAVLVITESVVTRWALQIARVVGNPILRVAGQPPLPDDWALTTRQKLASDFRQIMRQPANLAWLLVYILTAHAILLSTLALILTVFQAHLSLPNLFISYSFIMFAWFVSPTPQGVGFVEAAGALILKSFGLPGAVALGVPIIYRVFVQWLPLLIGLGIINHRKKYRREHVFVENWQVTAVSLLVAAMGFINLYSALFPALPHRMHLLKDLPLIVLFGSRLTSVIAGFGLILIAQQLRRRKQVAVWVGIAILLISAIMHLAKGLDYEEALLAISVAGILFTQRHHFFALSDRPSVLGGLRATAFGLLATWAFGTVGLYLLTPGHFHQNLDLLKSGETAYRFLFTFTDPHLLPITHHGQNFLTLIQLTLTSVIVLGAISIFRPVFVTQGSPDDRRRARALVDRWGNNPLNRLILLSDKRYHFTPDRSGFVGFTTKRRFALALGDPVGPPRRQADQLRDFILTMRRRGYEPAFYQAGEHLLGTAKRLRCKALCIGHEAVVNLKNYSLEGSRRKNVRNTVQKLQRLGYQTKLVSAPASPELLNELQSVSNSWLSQMGVQEKRFSLGWFDVEYLKEHPLMILTDQLGQVMALTNLLPFPQTGEIGIDLMRSRQDAPSGAMDLLLSDAMLWAKSEGFIHFSLGLSPMYLEKKERLEGLEKALQQIYFRLSSLYNFKGLSNFKDKFTPDWEPRYLIYDQRSSLPAVAHALLQASAGDGYLLEYLSKKVL